MYQGEISAASPKTGFGYQPGSVFHDERVRQEIQEGLNVVENWNSANSFIFYGKSGEIVGLDVKAMRTQKAGYSHLHLKYSKEIFFDLVDLAHSIDRQEWQSYVDARDYESLERFIVRSLMGR